jgi:hypothetical protein
MTTCGRTSYGPGAPRLLPRTTHAVRAELQRSKASVAALAERFGINPKTVLKWRGRGSVEDHLMGPKEARSTVLTPLEAAAIVAFRPQTLLPLDDVLFALQPPIPHLTRASLHRLRERHGILPTAPGCERESREEALQALPDRLLPHRSLRAAARGKKAVPLRGHRSHVEVRLWKPTTPWSWNRSRMSAGGGTSEASCGSAGTGSRPG